VLGQSQGHVIDLLCTGSGDIIVTMQDSIVTHAMTLMQYMSQ